MIQKNKNMEDRKTFIFWSNMLCLLHSSFLRNLGYSQNVILVAETDLSEEGINQYCFHVPDYGNVKTIVAPNDKQIDELLNKKNAIHIFWGVQSFKMPDKVFRLAVSRKLFIGIFSEPYNWLGLKGKWRWIKYLIFRIRYGKYIRFILTTGERGRWCFESAGFKRNIIYDWGYFTETPDISIQQKQDNDIRLLFIGQICERKNILSLVSICKELNVIDNLQIVGSGHLEKDLLQAINNTKCKYLGKVPNQNISKIIVDSDVLILPSIHDGWGAVVNEALMCGVPVVVSNRCGASILINDIRGRVFSIEKNNLKDVLQNYITRLPYDINKREKIRDWAMQSITGQVVSQYFVKIMEHVLHNSLPKPVAPWLHN
ncbi:MAG: glycosyltransferase [Bacteroidales bacterium]|jgi:glycosyltransferase involved in cell wall biosynthesis|nr:glycosyltransferase [Bacteroidales bacterium]